MKIQTARLCLGLAVALALTLPGNVLAVADPPNAFTSDPGQIVVPLAAPALGAQAVVYDQTDNALTGGVTSYYGTDWSYDIQAADDFYLPAGSPGSNWVINQVEVQGFYQSFSGGTAGPAQSASVYVYQDAITRTTVHVPGTLIFSAANVVPSAGLNTGSFTLDLNPPLTLTASTQQGQFYWLSVQTNGPKNKGSWLWSERGVQGNNPSDTRGIRGVCLNWDLRLDNCTVVKEGHGPDLVFRLSGANNLINAGPSSFQINPGAVAVGNPDFMLEVIGGNFFPVSGLDGSRISWNRVILTGATIVTGSNQISAIVPAGLVSSVGTAEVRVVNLSNNGLDQKESNPQIFTILPSRLFLPVLKHAVP